MSTFLTEITCVWGGRGSGKTTLAKKLVADALPPQIVIIDPLAKDGTGPYGVIRALESGERSVVCNSQRRDEQIGSILAAYSLSTKETPIYALCDEAPAYLDRTTDALNKIMFQGRHASFGMCLIGQRPTAVDAQIRSQAAVTYWMKLADARDIQTAAQAIGTERARGLSSLTPGQFIKHPE